MASSTGFEAPGSWSFAGIPDDTSSVPQEERHMKREQSPTPELSPTPEFSPTPEGSRDHTPPITPLPTDSAGEDQDRAQQHSNQRAYPPRTCRICFDVVHPTVDLPSEHIPGFLQGVPRVRYESTPEDGGRLIRPCLCKGTSKYVHEGCLNQWRLANPGNARNYYECPTCKFKYRLERLRWAEYVQSTLAELTLTVLVFVVSIFLLGFIADPIINLYLEPSRSISWIWSSEPLIPQTRARARRAQRDVEPDTWFEHFLKGVASLGLLSFVKLFFTAPLQWIRLGRWDLDIGGMRIGGGHGANRPGARGRDRVAELSWVVIVIGVMTFIFTVFKAVRAWSRRALTGLGSRVLDVQVDDNDQEEEDASTNGPPPAAADPQAAPL